MYADVLLLRLNHPHSLLPHLKHDPEDVHDVVLPDPLDDPVQRYHGPGPAHPGAAVHQDGVDEASVEVPGSAVNRSIGSTTGCTITEKAPTRAFSWLKAAATAFTLKTLLRHYAKLALTPRSLNVKLGPRRKGHKGRVVCLVPYDNCIVDPISH